MIGEDDGQRNRVRYRREVGAWPRDHADGDGGSDGQAVALPARMHAVSCVADPLPAGTAIAAAVRAATAATFTVVIMGFLST